MGKRLRNVLQAAIISLNPCFGGFGWERLRKKSKLKTKTCLNPCFGGFGWERTNVRGNNA